MTANVGRALGGLLQHSQGCQRRGHGKAVCVVAEVHKEQPGYFQSLHIREVSPFLTKAASFSAGLPAALDLKWACYKACN